MGRPRSDVGLSTGNVPGFRRWMWKSYPRVGFHKSRSVSGWFCKARFCCWGRAVTCSQTTITCWWGWVRVVSVWRRCGVARWVADQGVAQDILRDPRGKLQIVQVDGRARAAAFSKRDVQRLGGIGMYSPLVEPVLNGKEVGLEFLRGSDRVAVGG
jgi:hypothetical protein